MSRGQIASDQRRFQEIVRGRARRDLLKHMSSGTIQGQSGDGKTFSVPIPDITIPRFIFGSKQLGGVGMGDGEEGDEIGQPGQQGDAEAGNAPGDHGLEAEFTLEELAVMLGEKLQLPAIQPKGKQGNIEEEHHRYTGISKTGSRSLRHGRRTHRAALMRQMASGLYNPDRPVIIPFPEDMRFRTWKTKPQPEARAVIIYIMDISGSMGPTQKEIVRRTTFWIDVWLRVHYPRLETRFIVHDSKAWQVDRATFFRIKSSGGTLISTAYQLLLKLITEDYPPEEWNIYPFQFSDGDNYSGEDNDRCVGLLQKSILPVCNQFGYGQVYSEYGSGHFLEMLDKRLRDRKEVVLVPIRQEADIPDAIRRFLGRGQ